MRTSFVLVAILSTAASANAAELLRVHSPQPLAAESLPEALDPWETPIAGFFVRTHNPVPSVDVSRWQLVIDGLVDKPLTLTVADLKKRAPKTFHAVLECAGNGRGLQKPGAAGIQWLKGAVGNAEWTGVSLAALLKEAGIKTDAKFARVEGADSPAAPGVPGFVRSIPLSKVTAEDTIIAYAMNRESMPVLHGAPMRLILPNWYGQNWTKWLTHVTLTATEDEGFFMKKGYRMPKTALKTGEAWDAATGVPIEQLRVQTLLTMPRDGSTLPPTEALEVLGKAFSGGGAITKVDLSIDEGKTWVAATVDKPHASGGWQEFRAKLPAKTEGALAIWSRATDAAGQTQPLDADWNPPGYLRNAVDRITLTIAKEGLPLADAVLRDKCYKCHAAALIDEQRLSPGQWEKVLGKMETFGVAMSPAEKASLVAKLSKLGPDLAPPQLHATSYERANVAPHVALPAGHVAPGAKLFGATCAGCHGAQAEGGTGPRLKGRLISESDFRTAVMFGQRGMPAFSSALRAADVADLLAFLNAPPTVGH